MAAGPGSDDGVATVRGNGVGRSGASAAPKAPGAPKKCKLFKDKCCYQAVPKRISFFEQAGCNIDNYADLMLPSLAAWPGGLLIWSVGLV